MNAADPRGARSLFLVPALLLAVGLIVDFGFTRPRLLEVDRLQAQRLRVVDRAETRAAHEREGRELARCLGSDDLPTALALQKGDDPVNFLGAQVDQASLQRLQLSSRSTAVNNGLRQSDYSLRVQGSYAGITKLVRSLELGPRVVAINAISITPVNGSLALEAQLDLSVYDVAGSRP